MKTHATRSMLLIGLFSLVCIFSINSWSNPNENEPIMIKEETDLEGIKDLPLDGTYYLTKDIALTKPFTPIGTKAEPFTGTFCSFPAEDGQKIYKISNLHFGTSSSDDCVGLFGSTRNATIKDLNLQVAKNVEGRKYVGTLIGFATGKTKVDNIKLTFTKDVTISGEGEHVGGLIGQIESKSQISNLSVTRGSETKEVKIEGPKRVGGLTGALSGEGCSAKKCEVVGITVGKRPTKEDPEASKEEVGGLIGYCWATNIKGCSTDNVTVNGIKGVGGLVGFSDKSTITDNSYCQNSTVTGTRDTGGLVGKNIKHGLINDSYVKNVTVNGNNETGGLVGYNYNGEIKMSYASEVTVKAKGTGTGGLVGGVVFSKVEGNEVRGDSKVDANSRVGGLVGENKGTTFWEVNVENTNVSGWDFVGGLIGYSEKGIHISEASVKENVTVKGSEARIGGLIGDVDHSWTKSNITNSFSWAKIEGGTKMVGGLLGHIYQYTNSIWGGYNTYITNYYFAGSINSSSTSYSNGLIGELGQAVHAKNSFWTVDKGEKSWGGSSKFIEGEDETEQKKNLVAEAREANWPTNNVWILNDDQYPTLSQTFKQ